MAVESFLTFAVQESLIMLGSIAADKISGAWGLKGDLDKLSQTTRMIQGVLQDAEEKQATDDRVKTWLEKLQDAVYAAEDVLDEFSYETLRRQVKNQGPLNLNASDFVSRNNHFLFRLKMAKKVKKINESLADIEREATLQLKLENIVKVDRVAAERTQFLDRNTDSSLGRSEKPIGRTKDVEGIIHMLQTGSSNRPFLTFIHIVGIGGIGKTTLAKLVFQQAKEKHLFEEVMWVCVSDDFNYKRILLEMLQKLDKSVGALAGDDAIVSHLREKLKDKKFLLVLDDAWNDESARWKSLIDRLGKICGKEGNFVLVTTRMTTVAEVVDIAPRHLVKLEQLPNKVCWSIIQNKCLEVWEESDSVPKELESIGFKIAENCRGVPLVAQVLGGTLSSRKDRAFWLTIQNSSTWEDIGANNNILPVLKLSFDHLPPSIKRCFTYCSLFPKDFEFEKEVLIQLWMAEDFLHAGLRNDGGTDVRSMEEVGEEYFRSLFASSFFQDARVDYWGNITNCKMHDLLHDLASSISKTEMLPFGNGYVYKTCDDRRFNFECDRVSEVTEWATNSAIRTVFCKFDVSKMLPNLKSLRTLNICKVDFKELPFAAKKLKHLRYLNISGNKSIEAISDSITELYNLQTLRLHECASLKKLPGGIGNLVNLRHIYFDDRRLMTFKVVRLTNLQTLPFFVVGSKQDHRVRELKSLTQLRGEVEICNLEHVGDGEEAKGAELEKKKLSKLKLIWNEIEEHEREAEQEREASSSSSRKCNHEDVLRCLQPAPCLQSLIIEGYMGKGFPQWFSIKSVDSPYPLENLTNLELRNCRKCEKMPTLGHLPCLKKVVMEGMDDVKFIGNEFYGENNNGNTLFPVLEEWYVGKMKSLVEWGTPLGTKSFPKLRRVKIEECSNLRSFGLSQSISSANMMPFLMTYRGEVFRWRMSCLIDLKSLEYMSIIGCPKLTFPHLGLTSFQELTFLRVKTWEMENMTKEVLSNGIEECLQTMEVEVDSEMVKEFPKYCKALEFWHSGALLGANGAFDGLSSLQHLKIQHCGRLQSIATLSSLTSLKCLQIQYCEMLESIPTLWSLTSLQHLEIQFCKCLESIPSLSSLTSLKHLQIDWCERLRSIPSLSSLTSLERLQINCCHSLKSVPTLSSLISLKHLQIDWCESLESIPSLSSLTSLETLDIGRFCGNLRDVSLDFLSTLACLEELSLSILKSTSFPAVTKSCHCLRKLVIESWDELSDLSPISFCTLTSLESLWISYCPKLRSLPDEIKLCTSLKELTVQYCKGLISIDDDMICSLKQLKNLEWGGFSNELDQIPGLDSIHLLSSLEKVNITGWDKLTSLPHQIQHLTFITELRICDFNGVESLSDWLSNLSSLRTLSIYGCKNLKVLPTASPLTRLDVYDCPLLKGRFGSEMKPKWNKILEDGF